MIAKVKNKTKNKRRKAHANGNGNGNGKLGGRLGSILGEDFASSEESGERSSAAKQALGHPIACDMRLKNKAAEERRLEVFLKETGIKQLGPAAWAMCDNGNVIWTFAGMVSPEAARAIIKKLNDKNRIVGHNRAAVYATDMVTNRWRFTAEPLIFSNEFELLDGQNRLLAVAASGEPLSFLIVFGLSPRAICHMGAPLSRSNAHLGQAEGRKYAAVRTATIGLLHRYEKSTNERDWMEERVQGFDARCRGPRDGELDRHYEAELDSALEFIHGLRWGIGKRALSKSVATFMLMLMSRKNANAARFFMHAVADGVHAVPGSPAFAVRHRLTRLPGERIQNRGHYKNQIGRMLGKTDISDAAASRGGEALVMRLLALAWNSFCSGRRNGSGQFKTGNDTTTIGILKNLAEPCRKSLDEVGKAFTPDVLNGILERAKACREREEKLARAKKRDEGDVKLEAIERLLKTL